MKCGRHHYEPLARSRFQIVVDAAWASEYCKCGAVQHHCVSPHRGPIEVDQPAYVTHAVVRDVTPSRVPMRRKGT